jgi:hypothetical protein
VKAEANSAFEVARKLWTAAAEWHQLQSDAPRVQEARRRAAETYALEAQAVAGGLVGASRAVHFTKEAITNLRSLGESQRARVDELRRILQEHQQASLKELVPYGASIDATSLREPAIAAVRGKTVEDALRTLAHLVEIPVRAELREFVIESAKETPLQALLNRQILDADGRTTAKRDGLRPDSPPEVLDQHAREPANAQHNGFGALVIEPALGQIRVEHNLAGDETLRICGNLIVNTRFCSPTRQPLYARALAAGLVGDFVLSTHLLVPQIEESLRHLLREAGYLTSGLTDEQIELEHGLGSILARPETATVLGEDAAFDLQGLLVEHLGSNIRNRTAHGLIDPAQFDTPTMRYLWWLALRLLLDHSASAAEAAPGPSAPS